MSGEKTEEPTEQRLKQSREKGDVAQRKNILEAFTICAGIILVFALWPMFYSGISSVFDATLDSLDKPLSEKRSALLSAGIDAALFGLIVTAILSITGLGLHLLLNKFNFAPKSLTPKFEKFNPVSGLKNIFSKSTFYNFGRMMVLFPAICAIFYAVVQSNLGEIVRASYCGPRCIADIFYDVFVLTLILIIGLLIILAAIDFKIQTMLYLSQSKMTKDEVKREYKGNEGDPLIKSARRQIALEDAESPTLKQVTHVVFSGGFMVGLFVQRGYYPFVLVKADGQNTRKVVARCRTYGAKCVNLPDVARDYHRMAVVGRYMSQDSIAGLKKIMQHG